MSRKQTAALLLAVLFGVFVLINTPWLWKWMYPIRYQEEIMQAAKRYDVDPFLILAIIRTESGFDTRTVSKKGAVGLMQLMPETADWVIRQGKFQESVRQELDEPRVNIELGTWYLAYLLRTFDGDPVLAVAAYNAGPGKVSHWLTKQQWDGTRDSIEDIPYGETRHYVQRVLYFHDRYRRIYSQKLE